MVLALLFPFILYNFIIVVYLSWMLGLGVNCDTSKKWDNQNWWLMVMGFFSKDNEHGLELNSDGYMLS